MDRFIGIILGFSVCVYIDLKSNMDRFIVTNTKNLSFPTAI